MSETKRIWSVNNIQTAMFARGSHWWDADSMRFFGTRVCGPAWNGPNGVFFVTSEKPPHGDRGYTIRQFDQESCELNTVGELCGYSNRETAVLNARKMAGADDHRSEDFQPVTDFDVFLRALAVHGTSSVTASCARQLIRLGKRHNRKMVDYCNGVDIYDADGEPLPALKRLRANIEGEARRAGAAGVVFSGDPRGCTVKLQFSDGERNDWAGDGYCIPGA